ncbi:MAG: DUF4198 domain-containing protein [Pseudomonadota bacterium]
MKTKLAGMTLLLLAAAPGVSLAARAWLLPSQTVLARSGGWVTVDAAMADDLFSFNQGAMPVDSLVVTAPDGQPVAGQNIATGKTRSSVDLELRQPGTYRVAVADDMVMARWEEAGKPKRWRGAPAEMATGIPADAQKLEVQQMQRRVETFVSVGTPSVLKGSGAGLELVPTTHPNDLYAGETAQFRFMLDGKPAKDLEVEIIAGGTRYRDSPNEMRLKTGQDGVISVKWPAAGMYWIDASVEDENATVPKVAKRRASYNATVEVLTQ